MPQWPISANQTTPIKDPPHLWSTFLRIYKAPGATFHACYPSRSRFSAISFISSNIYAIKKLYKNLPWVYSYSHFGLIFCFLTWWISTCQWATLGLFAIRLYILSTNGNVRDYPEQTSMLWLLKPQEVLSLELPNTEFKRMPVCNIFKAKLRPTN